MARIRRFVVPLVALAALLSACTLTVRPGHTTATFYGSGVLVWGHLGAMFEFPGLVVVERHSGPHHFDAVFRTNASLHAVFFDVDRRMRDRGWFRRGYFEAFDRIRAEYWRGRDEATVMLTREDYANEYRVVIYD